MPGSAPTQLVAGTLMAESFDRGGNVDGAQVGHLIAGTLGDHKSGGFGQDLDSHGAFIPVNQTFHDKAPCLQERDSKGQDSNCDKAIVAVSQVGVRRLTPIECARLSGFPDDWHVEGVDEKGKAIKLSDTAAYRAYGNCCNVPVTEWIGKRIMESLK